MLIITRNLARLRPRPSYFIMASCTRNVSSAISTAAKYLITPEELKESFEKHQNVVALDASWYMPNSPRRPRDEFKAKRIPGSRFLDLDEVASEHPLGLKHMMPSPEVFAKACGEQSLYKSAGVIDLYLFGRNIRNHTGDSRRHVSYTP